MCTTRIILCAYFCVCVCVWFVQQELYSLDSRSFCDRPSSCTIWKSLFSLSFALSSPHVSFVRDFCFNKCIVLVVMVGLKWTPYDFRAGVSFKLFKNKVYCYSIAWSRARLSGAIVIFNATFLCFCFSSFCWQCGTFEKWYFLHVEWFGKL